MQRYLSRLGLTVATCVVSMLIAIVGVGFLLAAAYLAIVEISSPTIAALATGAAALVIAGLIALLARARMRRGALAAALEERPELQPSQGEFAAELGLLLGSQATSWIRSHALGAATLALIAGFVVGASPGLRAVLRQLVKPPR